MRRKDIQEVIDALLAVSLGLVGTASGLVSCNPRGGRAMDPAELLDAVVAG